MYRYWLGILFYGIGVGDALTAINILYLGPQSPAMSYGVMSTLSMLSLAVGYILRHAQFSERL